MFFEVEIEPGGPRYDEMHVGGGVGARVFLDGGLFRGSLVRERGGQGGIGREDIFVIHNGPRAARIGPGRARHRHANCDQG